MDDRHLVIVGGGLAGLAAGCYARRSGYRTTIVEHNLALGGVCTAWPRGKYVVDGCIHWLTGGPFLRVYEELGIVPAVELRPLSTWMTYRDVRDGTEVAVGRDLDDLVAHLRSLSPADAEELARLRRGAAEIAEMKAPLDAPELWTIRDRVRAFWEMRGAAPALVHFRKPIGDWAREHLVSPRLQRIFTRLVPETAPAFFLLMVLGYLERGYLSRPVGGTAAFRDALIGTYRDLGGATMLHSTVDEILVEHGRAAGVRLADGTMLRGDRVLSTAGAPETVLRLLCGRYDAEDTRDRLARWKLFDPIVLASFGVEQPYLDVPQLLVLDGISPLTVGGRANDCMYVRVGNDDRALAPPGHSVIQTMLPTDYDWWATRGHAYRQEKDAAADAALSALERWFPELRASLRMTDVATPLTYWGMTRAWRGAYEGYMPNTSSFFGHVPKKLHGLDGCYLAGQWVEPGGGVPTALMSGRQAIQLLCADDGRRFTAAAA